MESQDKIYMTLQEVRYIKSMLNDFHYIDLNDDADIDFEEMQNYFNENNFKVSDVHLHKLLRATDQTKTNGLSKWELSGVIRKQTKLIYQLLKNGLVKLDKDKNGYLSRQEVTSVVSSLKSLKGRQNDMDMSAIFQKVDINNDNRVDYLEFIKYFFHMNDIDYEFYHSI
ncbi:hypothetical protein SNEBB_003282 [Seison nebaliae]|nr:hypothetical protein SNEBB_003282 [Seison nebaliae]